LTTTLENIAATTSVDRRYRATIAAVHISMTWFGVLEMRAADQNSLGRRHVRRPAMVSVGREELLDNHDPAFRAMTNDRSRSILFRKGVTCPYSENETCLILLTTSVTIPLTLSYRFFSRILKCEPLANSRAMQRLGNSSGNSRLGTGGLRFADRRTDPS
jgi:hypothetical protein